MVLARQINKKDNSDVSQKIKRFKRWVTSEVLPTIRKTGSYNSNPQKLEEHTTIHTEKLTIKADSVTIQNVNITNYIEEKPKRSTSKNNRKGDIKLMDENQKDFLRSQLEDYLQRQGVDTSKRNGFACFCGSKDGCFFVPKTNHERWKCFSEKHSIYEKSSGDIFEYVKQQNNVDFKQSCEILSKMYHIPIGIDATPKKNYTNFYSQALKNQQKAIDYLKSREIIHAHEIAQEFQIGYCNNYAYEFENNQPTKTTQAVIIPMSTESYSWRSITENLKKKSGTIYPLNLKSLKDNAIKKITNPILYEYYKQWCKKNGAYPHSSVNFKKQLKKNASYKKEAMSNGTRYYDILIGYKLRPSMTFIDKDKIVHEYY